MKTEEMLQDELFEKTRYVLLGFIPTLVLLLIGIAKGWF